MSPLSVSQNLSESGININDHQEDNKLEEVKQSPKPSQPGSIPSSNKQSFVVPKLPLPQVTGPQKDPNYVNRGIKLIVHYARMP